MSEVSLQTVRERVVSIALRVEEGTAVDVTTMKAEKVCFPCFDASSFPFAMDSSSVVIFSRGMGPGPWPLRLCSNGHPRQYPSASDHQSCFSVAELELPHH